MADKIVCEVCKKEFSGEVPAQQHYESKAHQKAMRNKELIDRYDLKFAPAQFKCDICNVNMNSVEVKKRHMNSPKHLEMERRSKTMASRDASGVNGISPEQGQVSSYEGKEYDFNGVRGYCYICKIELTSKAVADQHINGEKHAKKKASQQRTILQQPPVSRCVVISTCNACGEDFFNQHEVEEHFSSQKHKEKLASFGTISLNTERAPTLSTVSEPSYYPTENLALVPSGSSSRVVIGRIGYGSANSTAVAGVYEFNGSSGHCHICNVALTSEENAKAHLLGTRHRKALVKSGEDSRKEPQAENTSEYYFNGDRGKCLLCDIDLTSEQHAQDHLSGAKHAKAVQRQAEAKTKDHHTNDGEEYEMNGKRGFCHVCQLELTSVEHATQHINGMPHAKTKLVWEKRRQTVNQAQGILSPSSGAGERLDMEPTPPGLGVIGHWSNQGQGQRSDLSGSSDSSTFLSDEDVTKRKYSGNVNQNQAHQVPKSPSSNQNEFDGFRGNIPISEDGTQEYWFNGLTGYCNLCSIDLTSQAHAMQHINGKNHAKARQRSQTKPIGSSDVNLYCKICKVPFSGQESAQQHYKSDKHRKREQVKMCPLGEPPAPDQKVLDNTNWYPCIVCGCYLNSKEQLESHEQSVSHKVAKEGLNSLGLQETLVMTTGDSSVERIVSVTKGSFDSGHQQTIDRSKSSTRQELKPGSVTLSKDSVKFEPISLDQHGNLDPASLRQSYATSSGTEPEETLLKSVYDFQQSDEFNTLPSNLNANNFNSGSLQEKEIHKESFLSQISKSGNSSSTGSMRSSRSRSPDSYSRSPSVGIDSHAGFDKNSSLMSHGRLSSNQGSHSSNQSSLESGPQSSGSENRMPSLEPIDMNEDIPDLVSMCTSMSELKIKKDLNNAEKKEVKVKAITKKKERKERKQVEVTTLDHIPVPGKVRDVSDIETLGLLSSGESTPGHRTRRGEGTDTARAVRNRTSRGKTSEGLDRSVSQESESNDDPDKDTDSSIERKESVGHGRTPSMLMSLISQKLKDVPRKPAIGTLAETENSVRKNFKHYCATCKVPMDTEKALQDHLKGRLHRMKSAKEPACSRQLPALNKIISTPIAQEQKNFTETTPRSYQWELFGKVMTGDRICFLPTGTGKTLIGCMAIGAMLDLNPSHQVLFLVTKVLLVVQQGKYIRNQLANRKYRRFDPNDPSKMVERELKIAELCGGQQSTGGVPLWKHDIIVATAAYCENMLTSEVLRWQDQCLVIFDEAHHCSKNHSYNNLMATHHYKVTEPFRCKILGLTASPAGKNNYSMTVDMLRQLQINMGDSLIAIVEHKKEELKAYMSNAKIHIAVMETTPAEEQFQRDLRVYLLQCYMRLAAETNISEHSNLGLTGISKSVSAQELKRHAQDLTGDVLDELEALIAMVKPNTSSVDKRIEVQNLIGHIKCICMTISVVMEMGIPQALEEMQELMATNLNQDFDFAKQIGLPCQDILRSIEAQQLLQKSNLKMLNESINQEMSSNVKCLIKQLIYENYIQWNGGQGQSQPLALVLVKRRATATDLHESLMNHPEIVNRNLSVEKIVGHGAAAAEKGMSVAQQRKTLEEIKDHKYQVVIATAVAEEGIDLPECELVVSMNPPSTMTALVQMRGRARKLNSHFVIVCNDSKEEAKFSDLLAREENMIKAANFLVQNQNRQAAM